jgi:ferredoxin
VEFSTAELVYFSPTRTTKRVLEGIVRGIQVDGIKHLDLTPPEARTRPLEEIRGEWAIIGAPVYGGRIPPDAAQRLRRLKGGGAPAIVVVVYGNRAYEDALLELGDLVSEAGFVPVAGGAFLGEHSFSSDVTPIAEGRPDERDLKVAADFGRAIREKLREIRSLDEMPSLHVPGNYPYQEIGGSQGISPVTRSGLCTRSETCVSVCPTAAIALRDTVVTDARACILCCACVKNCPTGARVIEHPRVLRSARWLSENCSERKEPELYL